MVQRKQEVKQHEGREGWGGGGGGEEKEEGQIKQDEQEEQNGQQQQETQEEQNIVFLDSNSRSSHARSSINRRTVQHNTGARPTKGTSNTTSTLYCDDELQGGN